MKSELSRALNSMTFISIIVRKMKILKINSCWHAIKSINKLNAVNRVLQLNVKTFLLAL